MSSPLTRAKMIMVGRDPSGQLGSVAGDGALLSGLSHLCEFEPGPGDDTDFNSGCAGDPEATSRRERGIRFLG